MWLAHWEGGTPVCFLKTLLKYCGDEKPHALPTAAADVPPAASISPARFIR